MSFDTLFNVLFLAAVVALITWSWKGARERAAMFVATGKKLGMEGIKHTAGSLSGAVRGLGVEVMFVSGSKTERSKTKVEVTFSPCALMLHLRRQTIEEERAVKAGEAVDLTIGDLDFDAAWIVEGAPAERVTRLLANADLRARLMAFSAADSPSIAIEDGKLHLEKGGQDLEGNKIHTPWIELAIGLAEAVVEESRLPIVGEEVDAAGSDYRSVRRVDGAPAAAAKIAELKRLRAVRGIKETRVAAIAIMGVMTAIVLFFTTRDAEMPFAGIPVMVMQGIVTAVLVGKYREHRKSAPGVPSDFGLIAWIAGAWIVNATVSAWAFLRPH
ncbi:MAG: hypothetical protein U0441_17235 [Polyangiaceae bacterium]